MTGIALLVMLVYTTLAQVESIIVKGYGKRHKVGGMFFNAIICAFAAVFFIIKEIVTKGAVDVPLELLPYGLVSCLMYATGFYTMYLALGIGSFGLTRLVSSFSGIITITYGIIFLRERPHFITYIAIVLVFVSVFLMRFESSVDKKDGESKSFSVRWLVAVLLCVISNGLIGVLSKAQQNVFGGECDSEFKAISYVGAFALLTVLGFILEKDNLSYILKHGTAYGVLAGIVNGGHNLMTLLLYTLAPLSVTSPMSTGLGLIASFALSVFLYKEKFTKMQGLAVAIGFLAFILFQIAAAI